MTFWQHSHGDDHTSYSFSFMRGTKIWQRKIVTKLDVSKVIVSTTFGFDPNGIIWFQSEQQILKFLTI